MVDPKKKLQVIPFLVGSPVEEWTEWRVFRYGRQVASFSSEKEVMAYCNAM